MQYFTPVKKRVISRYFLEGKRAQQNGAWLIDNPYQDGDRSYSWEQGWLQTAAKTASDFDEF